MRRRGLKVVVFGLSVSSSWGNRHATHWRGIARALAKGGNELVFFERDVPCYAEHRDLTELPGGTLVLYREWRDVEARAGAEANAADLALVTSYCPDAQPAARRVLDSRAQVRGYYDLDTPVTLDRLERGESVPYLPGMGLEPFDLVLSFSNGPSLEALRRLGARRVFALPGGVDPSLHAPVRSRGIYRGDLSYLGSYSADRQEALRRLFIEPAWRMPHRTFLIGGALYPDDFPWQPNIRFVQHVPPADHAGFYCSSPVTLSITRGPMLTHGFCPSPRLFEAAACGVPAITDRWPGLEGFFTPGEEILVADSADDIVRALGPGREGLAAIGARARERALAEHTLERRAYELLALAARHEAAGHLEA